MKKVFVGNLPDDATEDSVTSLFSQFGTVRGIELVRDVFTGKCRGFGTVSMEGHEARAAIEGLNGKTVDGQFLKVQFDKRDRAGRGGRRRR